MFANRLKSSRKRGGGTPSVTRYFSIDWILEPVNASRKVKFI